MLNCKDLFKIAKRGLFSNKVRFFLSLIGITIGIAGIVGIITIGEGKKKKVNEFVNRMGADIVTIEGYREADTIKDAGKPLSKSDIAFIKKRCPSIKEIAEISISGTGLEYYIEEIENDENIVSFSEKGVDPTFARVSNIEIIKGRFISEADVRERRKVCAIELTSGIVTQCKRNLKIGDYLTYGPEKIKIIGFVKTKAIFRMLPDELLAYWPISTAEEILIIKQGLIPESIMQTICIQSISPKKTKQLLKEVENAIKQRNEGHIPSNLKPYIYESLVEEGLKEVNRTTLIMLAIALIALIVGGIGIMNVMYISVMERIKEIGIRRAVGAKEIDVILQFLTEALFLCLSGGIIGIFLGLFIAYYFMPFFDIPFVISLPPITAGLLSACIIGLFAGLKPAIKASKLDPVEILR
ncbi:MAG: ABC transporter permease [Candidatus Desantisbacteria bacterium]